MRWACCYNRVGSGLLQRSAVDLPEAHQDAASGSSSCSTPAGAAAATAAAAAAAVGHRQHQQQHHQPNCGGCGGAAAMHRRRCQQASGALARVGPEDAGMCATTAGVYESDGACCCCREWHGCEAQQDGGCCSDTGGRCSSRLRASSSTTSSPHSPLPRLSSPHRPCGPLLRVPVPAPAPVLCKAAQERPVLRCEHSPPLAGVGWPGGSSSAVAAGAGAPAATAAAGGRHGASRASRGGHHGAAAAQVVVARLAVRGVRPVASAMSRLLGYSQRAASEGSAASGGACWAEGDPLLGTAGPDPLGALLPDVGTVEWSCVLRSLLGSGAAAEKAGSAGLAGAPVRSSQYGSSHA